MNAKEIEQKAQDVVGALKLSAAPVDVEKIAILHGIEVGRAPSPKFSGILIRKNGKSLLGLNSSESDVRQRFTVAHELGHYFLHGNRDVFVEYRENKKRLGQRHSLKEMQANMFAAALLMPEEQLKKDVTAMEKSGILENCHIEVLARKYDVSEQAMNIRLINLKFPHR
ncbi:MAG: ImmA/IrrE family metallo-endopeptidase [Candidatus Liptonbacteria bacterium]|nr:ImmA/IrrE family metallo-endopeptidase [Candidatus Liptonbacteria bacterium]